MLKLLKNLLLILLLITIGFAVYIYKKRPTQIIPYPYIVQNIKYPQSKKAETSHVLIIGDRMGLALNRFIPELNKNISKELQEPLNIFNWSKNNEGIHRTINKIKSLKSLPPIIIYQGSSEEFYEKKINIKKRKNILKNFQLFDNNKISTLLMTFPFISKFIYKNTDIQYLSGNATEDLTSYSPFFKQIRMELTYKIYEYEIEELINYVRSKDSNLIIVTTPINLEAPPKTVCKNSTTKSIEDLQETLTEQIKEKRYKENYSQAKDLAHQSIGNAYSHYLHGIIALKLLKFNESREALEKAEAFDCKQWRGSVIFNNIMKQKAKRNKINLIDFNNLVNLNLGRDTIFQNQFYPQHIYYQQLMKLLESKIKKTYKL